MTESEYYLKSFLDAKNWGDRIASYVFEQISGFKPRLIDIKADYGAPRKRLNYLTIGSVLDFSDTNSIVWGSGFIRDNDNFKFGQPKKVFAVRGPLSRSRLVELGVDCPEVFGDPALLFPKFYTPKPLEIKRLGIVPHFVDRNNRWVQGFSSEDSVRIINMSDDPFAVVDQICSCERIVSSSLHGIIIADAYGVNSKWMKLSDEVIGGNFKFRDYFLSVGRKESEPLEIGHNTKLSDVISSFSDYKIEIDLDKLLDVCPFNRRTMLK